MNNNHPRSLIFWRIAELATALSALEFENKRIEIYHRRSVARRKLYSA
jgi:hypothetical protein